METLDNQAVQTDLPADQTTGEVENTQEQPTKTYSREDVDSIMTKRLAKTYGAFHELCNAPEEARQNRTVFANWLKQKLEDGDNAVNQVNQLNGKITDLQGELFNAKKELSFIHNNVDPNKYDDILTYFKGKELNFTEEALKNELLTHQDWLKKEEPKTTISLLGKFKNDNNENKHDEMMKKIFG